MNDATAPLIVDMDGSLIRNDTTYDLVVQCLRWAPHMLPFLIYKFLVSKPVAKRWLAERFADQLEPAHLPYEQAVLDKIDQYRAAGQPTELLSGADDIIVQLVAAHLGSFSFAQGSNPSVNLVSDAKAELAAERHPGGFKYIGDSRQDIAVWRRAKGGYGIRAPKEAENLLSNEGAPIPVEALVEGGPHLPSLLRALRPHQWSKNLLLFVVPGMLVTSLTAMNAYQLALSFLSFSFLASATYLLNDLFDMTDDRAHTEKRKRPLASGSLSVPLAMAILILLGVTGFGLAALVHTNFVVALAVYTGVTLAYSFRLKRAAVLDVLLLAFLFCIRVVAGATVINAEVTAWFLSFISLFFLSLAIGKRVIEIQKLEPKQKVNGRGYIAEDQPILIAFGSATGIGAIISFMIYGLVTNNVLFNQPVIIFATSVVMLGWLLRLWLLLARGEVDGDPVLFAVKDRMSFACLGLAGLLISLETAEAWWSNLF